jgi:type IV pilus assembly protein PilQ
MRALLLGLLLCAGPATAYSGKKITVDLQDAEIGNVLRLLADVSGKNFVYGEDVKGKITMKLKNVPWDQALDVILKTKGLRMRMAGNIIRVAPADVFDKEDQAALDYAEQYEKKAPLTTRIIPVNYANAKELEAQVKALLSPRGSVTVDTRTNTLIVRDVRGSAALR